MDSKYLLALNCHPKIGSQTLKKIINIFPDPSIFWKKYDTHFLVDRMGEKIADLIGEAVRTISPDEVIEKLSKNDIGYITIKDNNYPKLLKELSDCPAVLYIKGSAEILSKPSIAIVGSRKYSFYGRDTAKKLTKEMVQGGLAVVSGLALGIDAIVHETALGLDGITIGVLGCGVDKVYPTSNSYIGRRMIERGGAIISEFPPGSPPLKQNFPLRNRIIAGLSLGTLVVEAAAESGALITAYQALEYSREVFAIPGNINSPTSLGTNKLIQQGAKLVLSGSDIFDELRVEQKKISSKARDSFKETEEEGKIREVLITGEKTVDEIINQSGLNIIAVSTFLTTLEMKGMIANSGGRYRLIEK